MPSNISILRTPPSDSPVYNSIEILVKENDAPSLAQPNYHFVIDIETETLGTKRFRVAPEPTLSYGKQDAGPVLEGFIEETIAQYNSTNSFVFGLTRPNIKYKFNVYSGWDVSGTFTVDPDGVGAVSTAFLYAWCASLGKTKWINQINLGSPFNTWVLNTANGVNGEFLTNYKTPRVSINDLGWHWLLTDTPTDMKLVEIKTYDSDGGLIQTVQSVNATSTAVTNSRLLSVSTSPQSLNNIVPALFAGSQPIITSSVATYTVQIKNAAFAAVSELLTFTIDEPCGNYTEYRLHFLNELGGFDAFTFKGRNRRSKKTTRKSYNRTEDNISSTTIVYKHEENGKQDYYSKSAESIKLRSDYLTDAEWEWLHELVDSPQVYLEFVDGNDVRNFKPVRVTTSDWIENKEHIDKLFTLELDIELSHEDFRQRR